MRKMLLITQSEISSGMDFIEKGLTECEIGKKQCLKTMLVAEESLQKLIMNAENEDEQKDGQCLCQHDTAGTGI